MKELTDVDKQKLAKAQEKRDRKASKALETRLPEVKPTGTKKAPSFFRVSNGRKKRWARQYMMHRKSGTIVKVEVNE